MRLSIVVLMGLLFFSCSMINKAGKNMSEVKVLFQKHKPYCGGAKPTAEMEKGFDYPLKEQVYYLFSEDDKKQKLSTNELGLVAVNLAPGKYKVFKGDKIDLSIAAFEKAYGSTSKFLKLKGKNCLQEWKSQPDFILEIVEGKLAYTLTENHRCYTGANPCLIYDGPYHP